MLVSAALTDIRLRYRNTFTDSQIMVWMNDEVQELYEIFEFPLSPYEFPTQNDIVFYPIPTGLDIDRIKAMTIQINTATEPEFSEVPYLRTAPGINEEYNYWYTIVGDSFFINIPGGAVDDRTVYVFSDQPPDEITATTQDIPMPRKYAEIFKLGVLKRIAAARKDIAFVNNYDAEHEQKTQDMIWMNKMREPEFVVPADVMPKTSRWRNGRDVIVITQME